MEHKKTKIVLDADVIIHFMEANYFSILPDIFPEYEYLILDVVYNEISQNSGTKDFIDKYLHFFPKLKKEVFVSCFLIRVLFIATHSGKRRKCMHDLLQGQPRCIGKQ
jgi:hypothetical protein